MLKLKIIKLGNMYFDFDASRKLEAIDVRTLLIS